ncbi:MAG: hypothetical protein KAV87_37320 [Desulfobacteraceae bacterium]|nr:hypothetical protein [Desulfobacteraceae bacterium]
MTKQTMEGQKAKANDKLTEPVLLIGTLPCYNQLINSVWLLIKEAAALLAKMSRGEYTEFDVYKAIWFGHSTIYVGYYCDSKEDKAFAEQHPDNVNVLVAKYVTLKREKDFVGYTIVRLGDRGAHIWQAFVTEKFRGTPVFEECVKFVLARLAEMGAREVTFSSIRKGWGDKIKSIGFEEGLTTFHRTIEPVENNDHMQV